MATFDIHIDCDNYWVYENELNCKLPFDSNYFYTVALRRIIEVLDSYSIKGTFFIIGKDLDLLSCQDFCNYALQHGHLLGNHSFSHPQNFGSLGPLARQKEILKCHTAIKQVTGIAPTAFRAPGYAYSDEDSMYLADLGYKYNSSVLPGPTTFLIKALTFRNKAYRKKSLNVIANLIHTSSPRKLISKANNLLWEIPIAVMPFFKLPVHTSFIFLLGHRYLNFALSLMKLKNSHNILLLHGYDLSDDAQQIMQFGDISISKMTYKERLQTYHRLLSQVKNEYLETGLFIESGKNNALWV
jgi:hypothetical protein